MTTGTTSDSVSALRTSADAVRLLSPHCAPPFFTHESWANLLRKAEAFPAALSLSNMFERRLDTPDSPVDFFHLITRPLGGNYYVGRRDVLAGRAGADNLPPAFYEHDAWRRIRDFAREWLNESSPVSGVLAVWLEYDIREGSANVPVPLIFFTVEPHVSPAPILEVLGRGPYASPRLDAFRRCWDALPPTTRYRTAGILYSRPTEAARLIFVMSHDDAFRYLERVGWPGSVKELSARVEEFLRFHGEVALHVDVGPEGVEPQVGFEIYPDSDALYKNNGGDPRPLLDAAVRERLCSPELRDALAAWPGSDTYHLADGTSLRAERKFHHVKVVGRPDNGLLAKAYTTAEFEVTG